MTRPLCELAQENLEMRFYKLNHKISQIAKEMGISRNTVKKYLKPGEPVIWKEISPGPPSILESEKAKILCKADLTTLKQLTDHALSDPEGKNIGEEILTLAVEVANEIGINNVADQVLLEHAFYLYVIFRITYGKLLTAMNHTHDPTWLKNYDKMTRSTATLMDACVKIHHQFFCQLKQLEVKYSKTISNNIRAKIFIKDSEVSLNSIKVPDSN